MTTEPAEPIVPTSTRPPTRGEIVVRLVLGLVSTVGLTLCFLAYCTPVGSGVAAYLSK